MRATKSTLHVRRRRGQGMTEYIIIVGLIAILLIGAITRFKGTLQNTYDASTNSLGTNVTNQIK